MQLAVDASRAAKQLQVQRPRHNRHHCSVGANTVSAAASNPQAQTSLPVSEVRGSGLPVAGGTPTTSSSPVQPTLRNYEIPLWGEVC